MTKNWLERFKWIPALGLWVVMLVSVAAAAALIPWQDVITRFRNSGSAAAEHDHAGHDHAKTTSDAVVLSEAAQKTLGIDVRPLERQPFTRSIAMPGIVVERPGRTDTLVTAPLTGVVTKIYCVDGETVVPGTKLFEVRLTHEELVEAQSTFLKQLEELSVVQRDIDRLNKIANLAGKSLIEREYERDRLEAALRAQREALLLHGLSREQIETIEANARQRRPSLIQSLVVTSPAGSEDGARLLEVEGIAVREGEHVEAGQMLCTLTDLSQLFVEGHAFEQDAPRLNEAAKEKWPVEAVVETEGRTPEKVTLAPIRRLQNRVAEETRALHFYVTLPNQVERDFTSPEGHRFRSWAYLPGQRLRLLVPVEHWDSRLVLPVSAVAEEGAESYIFRQNGRKFERIPVQVVYRDQYEVVLGNDGKVSEGDWIARNGANQMQLAIKNASGGGVDPHAGHNH